MLCHVKVMELLGIYDVRENGADDIKKIAWKIVVASWFSEERKSENCGLKFFDKEKWHTSGCYPLIVHEISITWLPRFWKSIHLITIHYHLTILYRITYTWPGCTEMNCVVTFRRSLRRPRTIQNWSMQKSGNAGGTLVLWWSGFGWVIKRDG